MVIPTIQYIELFEWTADKRAKRGYIGYIFTNRKLKTVIPLIYYN